VAAGVLPVSEPTNIRVVVGDLFRSSAQTLVNTVNTEGVMGKGIALEFRKRFPAMHADYIRKCALRQVRLGEPYLYRGLDDHWVLNFPTKRHWRSHSRLSDIENGLRHLYRHYREWGIESLAVPPLGSGLGGLEWRVVGRVLYRAFSHFDIPVELYAPHGTPESQLTPEFLGQDDSPLDAGPVRLPPAWVALVEILDEIERQPYRWPVGRVAFQKIAYFATEAGVPTDLEFTKKSYGPFATDLARVKAVLINNGLLEEAHLGRMMQLKPGPALEHARDAYSASLDHWHEAVVRVADLFLRMDTRQAEVAATAHFAAKRLVDSLHPAEVDVLEAVKEWKARRAPQLSDEEIAIAIRNLLVHGWISVEESPDLPLPADYRAATIAGAA
jgi:O-acetyl-ADP-ribose deacetylase (regulator of RNase III)/uncharacterized protein YwgA